MYSFYKFLQEVRGAKVETEKKELVICNLTIYPHFLQML